MKKLIFPILFLCVTFFSNAQVGINTEKPEAALHVNGDLIIKNTTQKGSSSIKPLFIDTNGQVVSKEETETISPIFGIQADRTIITTTSSIVDDFNNCIGIDIPYNDADVIVNNLDFTVENGAVKVGTAGMYLINSGVNIKFGTSKNGVNLFVNVRLERSSDGGATWKNIIGYRPIFAINWNTGQMNPAVLPSIIIPLAKNDLIRCKLNRTMGGSTPQGSTITSFGIEASYSTPASSLYLTKV